jgi:hypothetical protein
MKVICINENEDGSANVEIDMTPDEMQIVLEVGFNKMLKDGMKGFENVLKSGTTEEIEQAKGTDS